MSRSIRKLMLASIALSQLALPSFSYAASRVFFDNFENGKVNSAWNYMECSPVTRARDGGTPHNSSHMLECGWNGAVAWNDSAAMQNAELNYWPYNNEILFRFWVRFDQDVDHKPGSKLFRLGYPGQDEIVATCQMEQGDRATLILYSVHRNQGFQPGPGGPATCGDHLWHKIELYIKNDTNGTDGVMRIWVDGVMVKEWVNTETHAPGAHLYKLNLISNWSSNPGWEHDANNHVYFNGIEIFSDVGTGAVGSMADATISASGGTASSLKAPKNLRVVQ